MPRPPLPAQRFPVDVEVDGKKFRGHYLLEGRGERVTVSLAGGRTKTTDVGEVPAETVARKLLQELAKESRERK